MTLIPPKRGLGRGLETLLADLPKSQQIKPAAAVAPKPKLQQERQDLILEAETLKSLLDDMENLLAKIEEV